MRIRRPRISLSAFVWLVLAAAYFLIPLVATLLFSIRSIKTNACCSAAAYGFVFHNGDFWHTLRVSGVLALETESRDQARPVAEIRAALARPTSAARRATGRRKRDAREQRAAPRIAKTEKRQREKH